MIKLLLVDDEPLVLVGLQSMLAWNEHDVEICGTARSGSEAMELIERHRPDIVVTDIVMPVMDGLELLTACREKYGRLPLFIVLTCVEEYKLVRKALSNQAVDYLIKLELTPEIMLQSIIKALDILHSLGGKKNEQWLPEGRSGAQTALDQFFIKLFGNLFENKGQFERNKEELGIDFSFGAYAVCYCELLRLNSSILSADDLMGIYTSAVQLAKEIIAKHTACYITSLNMRNFVITFCLEDAQSADCRKTLRGIIEPSIQITRNYFNVDLTCAVGIAVKSPLLIYDSYNSARMAFADLERNRPIHFCGFGQIPDSVSSAKGGKHQAVEKIKEYIRKNLDKRLTLNQLSEVFGFNPKYISLLFAKHAECSFVEFINAEKIAKAQKLLLEESAAVYEISEKLGYENPFYFSKVFKKHTGLSPRDYVRQK